MTERVVLVFRLQMFKPGETFIAAQVGALRRYRPVHVGWRLAGPATLGAATLRPSSALQALRLFGFGHADALASGLPSRATVVHAHFGVDALFALALARRLDAPLIVTLHGFDVSRSWLSLLLSLRPALVAFLFGWTLVAPRADMLLAVSERVANAARRRGAPAARLRRHVIGVDVERLRATGPGEPGLIVLVGRMVEKKGASVLLDALGRLAMRRPESRLVLVGDGPLREALHAQAAALGLADRVWFAGPLAHADALDWMRRAAIVAVPSLKARNGDTEGLPTVLLEAAALGRPIVASDVAAAEALASGLEALVTAAGDVEALTEALDRLLGEPTFARALGAAARRRVEADFDLLRQTAELETLYDQLLDERRARA